MNNNINAETITAPAKTSTFHASHKVEPLPADTRLVPATEVQSHREFPAARHHAIPPEGSLVKVAIASTQYDQEVTVEHFWMRVVRSCKHSAAGTIMTLFKSVFDIGPGCHLRFSAEHVIDVCAKEEQQIASDPATRHESRFEIAHLLLDTTPIGYYARKLKGGLFGWEGAVVFCHELGKLIKWLQQHHPGEPYELLSWSYQDFMENCFSEAFPVQMDAQAASVFREAIEQDERFHPPVKLVGSGHWSLLVTVDLYEEGPEILQGQVLDFSLGTLDKQDGVVRGRGTDKVAEYTYGEHICLLKLNAAPALDQDAVYKLHSLDRTLDMITTLEDE